MHIVRNECRDSLRLTSSVCSSETREEEVVTGNAEKRRLVDRELFPAALLVAQRRRRSGAEFSIYSLVHRLWQNRNSRKIGMLG